MALGFPEDSRLPCSQRCRKYLQCKCTRRQKNRHYHLLGKAPSTRHYHNPHCRRKCPSRHPRSCLDHWVPGFRPNKFLSRNTLRCTHLANSRSRFRRPPRNHMWVAIHPLDRQAYRVPHWVEVRPLAGRSVRNYQDQPGQHYRRGRW